jgi:hypothetical protein
MYGTRVPSKSKKQKLKKKKTYYLLASCQPLTNKVGSGAGSGSVSQWHGSPDPDLDTYQTLRILNTVEKVKSCQLSKYNAN